MRIKRLIVIAVIVLLILLLAQGVIARFFPFRYREEISKHCAEFQLDPAWVSAVICAESKFDAEAKSHKGAIGLMQIMENTGAWVADSAGITDLDLYDPDDNIKTGCAYLRMLLDQYNDSELLALCAYNAGEGRVDQWLKKSDSESDFRSLLFEETRDYYDKIVNYRKIYDFLYWRNEK